MLCVIWFWSDTLFCVKCMCGTVGSVGVRAAVWACGVYSNVRFGQDVVLMCEVSNEGRGTQVQSEPNLPASTRVGGNLGDGLALCQSHSYRLPRKEVVIPRLRGAWVVIVPRSPEGAARWCSMLRDLHASRGGRRTDEVRHTNGVGIWGCIPRGSARVASPSRGGVLYQSSTRNRPNIDGSIPYGFAGVGGTQETDWGVDGEAIHLTQYLALGSTNVVGEEEGREFTSVCGLQAVEQDDNQE